MNVLDQISDLLKSEDPEQIALAVDMFEDFQCPEMANWFRVCNEQGWMGSAAMWGGFLEDRDTFAPQPSGSVLWTKVVNEYHDLCEAIDGRKPGPQE